LIRKILIANRGEIACRVIRTCQTMCISTVAVFSDVDANALHVELADEAVHIGAAPAAQSYLNGEAIIAAAKRAGADAIHPGYGFLSENAAFAQAVIDAGLIWIGPPPSVIELMGDKRRAKLALTGIPLVPGYNGDDQSDDALTAAANDIGFPIMVKAAAGGGGKGMRLVHQSPDFAESLAAARREAKQAFGDDTLILERAIERPRHIEVQIMGDTHGNVMAFGERECSIQRRHQKIIEECPSPALDAELRERMIETAISIGRQIGYINAGTVEFIFDQDRNFYFLEMNTRLQVEHPVTEAVYNVDLVECQIEIPEGLDLTEQYPNIVFEKAKAIEVRLYAEDPSNGFLPTTGNIIHWQPTRRERMDHGLKAGQDVTIHYDPMLAKIIVWRWSEEDREHVLRELDKFLSKIQLFGVKTNIDFLRRLINHPEFVAGEFDTEFIDRHPELLPDPPVPTLALIAATIAKTVSSGTVNNWRNNPYRPIKQQFSANGETHEISLLPVTDGYQVHIREQAFSVRTFDGALEVDGYRQRVFAAPGENDDWWVHTPDGTFCLTWNSPLPAGKRSSESAGSLRSPMPGQVIRILVENGQQVSKGDILLIIEAMKMEHRITAPADGTVATVYYQVGQTVQAGVKLLDLQPSE
jgi:acetyl/propionyl-CoA carboxylase alpha subunit